MSRQAHRHDGPKLPPDAEALLAEFGYTSFRPGQREAIETLLAERRLLLVAPTGGGKSLSYQFPARLLAGTTVVVSPLIALMHDQVTALTERGLTATYLAATLDGAELGRRMTAIARGTYKLVYVAPERLSSAAFRALIGELECPLVAIDEAHCISEWGHDFRPEYLQIGQLLADLPRARVLACTATATPVVRDEILERLGLDADTPQIVRGFARPNLALRMREVAGARERRVQLDAVLAEALGRVDDARGCAIVYAPTRKAADEHAARLSVHGWRTAAYHAGLPAATRTGVHERFAAAALDVIVATNAFGMGIDRADVRAVVHLAPPGSVEAYYQEVGRAGRDGQAAIGLLMISPGDMALRRHLIERDRAANLPNEEAVRHKWGLFLELMRLAEGGSCRHDAILRYFGDEEETLAGCGRCDVCTDPATIAPADTEATTLVVRKALSAVARVHGCFGLQAAAKLLAGVRDARLQRTGLQDTPTFGALAERTEQWLVRLLRRCVTAGWADFHGGERPVIVLTTRGRAVMKGELPARLLLPPAAPRAAGLERQTSSRGASRRAAANDATALDETALRLFEALRRHRLAVARAEGVPPYVVASDRTLRDIASLRPRDEAELALTHGIGPAKLERYGSGLLEVVARERRSLETARHASSRLSARTRPSDHDVA